MSFAQYNDDVWGLAVLLVLKEGWRCLLVLLVVFGSLALFLAFCCPAGGGVGRQLLGDTKRAHDTFSKIGISCSLANESIVPSTNLSRRMTHTCRRSFSSLAARVGPAPDLMLTQFRAKEENLAACLPACPPAGLLCPACSVLFQRRQKRSNFAHTIQNSQRCECALFSQKMSRRCPHRTSSTRWATTTEVPLLPVPELHMRAKSAGSSHVVCTFMLRSNGLRGFYDIVIRQRRLPNKKKPS